MNLAGRERDDDATEPSRPAEENFSAATGESSVDGTRGNLSDCCHRNSCIGLGGGSRATKPQPVAVSSNREVCAQDNLSSPSDSKDCDNVSCKQVKEVGDYRSDIYSKSGLLRHEDEHYVNREDKNFVSEVSVKPETQTECDITKFSKGINCSGETARSNTEGDCHVSSQLLINNFDVVTGNLKKTINTSSLGYRYWQNLKANAESLDSRNFVPLEQFVLGQTVTTSDQPTSLRDSFNHGRVLSAIVEQNNLHSRLTVAKPQNPQVVGYVRENDYVKLNVSEPRTPLSRDYTGKVPTRNKKETKESYRKRNSECKYETAELDEYNARSRNLPQNMSAHQNQDAPLVYANIQNGAAGVFMPYRDQTPTVQSGNSSVFSIQLRELSANSEPKPRYLSSLPGPRSIHYNTAETAENHQNPESHYKRYPSHYYQDYPETNTSIPTTSASISNKSNKAQGMDTATSDPGTRSAFSPIKHYYNSGAALFKPLFKRVSNFTKTKRRRENHKMTTTDTAATSRGKEPALSTEGEGHQRRTHDEEGESVHGLDINLPPRFSQIHTCPPHPLHVTSTTDQSQHQIISNHSNPALSNHSVFHYPKHYHGHQSPLHSHYKRQHEPHNVDFWNSPFPSDEKLAFSSTEYVSDLPPCKCMSSTSCNLLCNPLQSQHQQHHHQHCLPHANHIHPPYHHHLQTENQDYHRHLNLQPQQQRYLLNNYHHRRSYSESSLLQTVKCGTFRCTISPVSLLWTFLSVLVTGTCVLSLATPSWIVHPDHVHAFGLVSMCVRDERYPHPRAHCMRYGQLRSLGLDLPTLSSNSPSPSMSPSSQSYPHHPVDSYFTSRSKQRRDISFPWISHSTQPKERIDALGEVSKVKNRRQKRTTYEPDKKKSHELSEKYPLLGGFDARSKDNDIISAGNQYYHNNQNRRSSAQNNQGYSNHAHQNSTTKRHNYGHKNPASSQLTQGWRDQPQNTGETLTSDSGLAGIPSVAWQAACSLFGAGICVQILGALLSIVTLIVKDPLHRRLASINGYLQTGGVILLATGLLVFPAGFNCPFFRYYCNNNSTYSTGHCSMGYSYIIAIMATCLSVFCPVLSSFAEAGQKRKGLSTDGAANKMLACQGAQMTA